MTDTESRAPEARLRFSRLPLHETCPASYAEAAGKPSLAGEAAVTGTAGHAILEGLVRGQDIPADADQDVANLIRDAGVGSPDHMREFLLGILPHGVFDAEVKLSIAGAEGTCDVLGMNRELNKGLVLDWKFEHRGGTDVDDRIQVLGYAAAAGILLGAQSMTAATFNVNYGKLSTVELDQDRMMEIRHRIGKIHLEATQQVHLPIDRRKYTAGDHCGYCPGRVSCPAQALIRKEAVVLFDPNAGLPDLPREKMPGVYEKWQQVRRAGEAFAELVRAEIHANGPIQDGSRWLGMNTRNVPPSKSWTTVKELLIELGHGDIAEAVEAKLSTRPKVPQQSLHLGKIKNT